MNIQRIGRYDRIRTVKFITQYFQLLCPFFPLLELAFLEARYVFIFDGFAEFVEFSQSFYEGI